jgi:hypothetical protein
VKDTWGFQMTGRYGEYADMIGDYASPDFVPQVIVDPMLKK